MPARSKKQQRLFAMALAAKRGKAIHSDKVKHLADSMSEKTLHDFAATSRKHLPEKKAADEYIINVLKYSFYKQAEKLIGGKADNMPDSEFPEKELRKGVRHEGEHTSNKAVAKEIAKDHLEERKDYYSALAKAKIGNY